MGYISWRKWHAQWKNGRIQRWAAYLFQDPPILGVRIIGAVLEVLHEAAELPSALVDVDVGAPDVSRSGGRVGSRRVRDTL